MTKRKETTRKNKEALILALEKSLGVVTNACKAVGISRVSFYRYYDSDKDFAKAVNDIENIALDFAESMLHANIKSKKEASVIFYLKTKGKRRGYIEKTQTEFSGAIDVNTDPFEKIRENAGINDPNGQTETGS